MRTPTLPSRQQGVVLFIALIVLVAMSLAGVALVRSVDTSLGIAGNMAFKQSTIQGSDLGIREAYAWLSTNNTGTKLQTTAGGDGYYSAQPAAENWFDSSQWGGAKAANGGAADAAGNTVKYIIHRMCTQADTPYNGKSGAGVDNICALAVPASGGSSGGSMSVGSVQFQGIPSLYYRITTRVDGPRNTVSIVQVTVLFKV